MSRPTELNFSSTFFIPQAHLWNRLLHRKVEEHRSQIVEVRAADTLDLIDECLERYPDLQKQFELLRKKEAAFAEFDSGLTLTVAIELADLAKAWRQRLNMQLIRLLMAANHSFDPFDLQIRLDDELLEHHNARVSLATWGSAVRANLHPIMDRYLAGRHTEEDVCNARHLVRALREQYANIPNLVVA